MDRYEILQGQIHSLPPLTPEQQKEAFRISAGSRFRDPSPLFVLPESIWADTSTWTDNSPLRAQFMRDWMESWNDIHATIQIPCVREHGALPICGPGVPPIYSSPEVPDNAIWGIDWGVTPPKTAKFINVGEAI